MKRIFGMVSALLLALATPIKAQDFGQGPLSVGLGLSTLGVTGDLTYGFAPDWSVRLLGGRARASRDGVFEEGVSRADYDATVRLGGIGPVVDFHPFSNGWRISSGVLFTDYRADIRFTGDITIGNEDYPDADLLGRVRTSNRLMPKLAVGYRATELFGSKLGLSLDAGVLYGGGFNTTLTDRSATPVDAGDLARFRNDIQDEIGGLRVLPYVSAGVQMNF